LVVVSFTNAVEVDPPDPDREPNGKCWLLAEANVSANPICPTDLPEKLPVLEVAPVAEFRTGKTAS